ncbi:hypothetical protein SMD22_01550 (plasmid) [Brevibacillus halotolerans]|nr:hypothetical protein SMD22_01550 [Brevibacillus halotolerans]
MIFKKKQKVKEYMKYEDGKIVSIDVEQNQKYKPIDQYPQETEPEIPFMEKAQKQAKEFFTLRRLKQIGFMIVLVFFLFYLYDAYKVFFATASSESNQVNEGTVVQSSKPSLKTETPEKTTVPTDNHNNGTIVTNHSEITEPTTTSKSSISDLLDTANKINEYMVQITSKEMTHLDSYHKKQANKIGLSNNLKQSREEKENLYIFLQGYKSLFAKRNMAALFDATEKRLIESILFTKKLDKILSTDSGSTYSLVEEYPKIDNKYIEVQKAELIKVLHENQIPYTINDQLNQVEFTIK